MDLEPLFQSGRIADIVIAVMLVEAVLLAAYHRKTGLGIEPKQLLTNLAAGVALFVAVRLALTGAHWTSISMALGASFLAHLADLRSRWRSG
jgi:hypothetical protein